MCLSAKQVIRVRFPYPSSILERQCKVKLGKKVLSKFGGYNEKPVIKDVQGKNKHTKRNRLWSAAVPIKYCHSRYFRPSVNRLLNMYENEGSSEI
jgi:hypothetical protein